MLMMMFDGHAGLPGISDCCTSTSGCSSLSVGLSDSEQRAASSPPSGVIGIQGCGVQLEQSAAGDGGGRVEEGEAAVRLSCSLRLPYLTRCHFLAVFSVSQTTTGDERPASHIKLFKDL